MSRFRYADHIEREGIGLFNRVCEMDLEGIVAKHSLAPLNDAVHDVVQDQESAVGQMHGREELFERERHKEPVAGWHTCDLACVEVEQ
jgi:hypothetical protein